MAVYIGGRGLAAILQPYTSEVKTYRLWGPGRRYEARAGCAESRSAAVFYNQRESVTALHLCCDDGTGFEIYGQFAGSSRLRFLSVRQARDSHERANVPYVAVTDWAPPLDPRLTHSANANGDGVQLRRAVATAPRASLHSRSLIPSAA